MVTSTKNNPLHSPITSENPSIYLQQNCLIEIIILGAIAIIAMLVRGIVQKRYKGFFSVKDGYFKLGLYLLGAGILLGGVGYTYNEELAAEASKYWYQAITEQGYIFKTLFFGGANFICMIGFYLLFRPMINWEHCKKDYIFFVLTMLACFVAFQVLYQYFTLDNIFYYTKDGEKFYCGLKEALNHLSDDLGIDRGKFKYGWGVYNNIGGMLTFMFPAAFYLACKKKYGFLYNILGNVLYATTILSMSRGAMLMGLFVYIASVLIVCIKAQNKLANRITFGVIFGILILTFVIHKDFYLDLFACLYRGKEAGFFDDSGRIEIWKVGLLLFKKYPIFGTGFYSIRPIFENGITGRFHNTIIQYMASCGVFGTLCYLYHRLTTFIQVAKNPTLEKTMLGICLAGLLLAGLLDCHMANIGPLIIYSFVLVFMERPEIEQKTEDPEPEQEIQNQQELNQD